MVDWKERQDNNVTEDGRDAYERDYGRVVHSASFRRLQSKTQVLGLGDSDFYRTRLTHSLEVSQLGESIARNLKKRCSDPAVNNEIPDSSLIRAICLAHDLGHPPFGHGGEVALNRCMLDWGGFEGNGQTLRITTKLEPYHESFGMNLTRRTVLGLLKYPAPYSEVVDSNVYPANECRSGSIFKAKPFKPPKCYLDSEFALVNVWLADGFGREDWNNFTRDFKEPTERGEFGQIVPQHKKTKHKTLDASIMELADDIAYGIHDLEDAIALKLIERDMFEKILKDDDFQAFKEWTPKRSYQSILDALFSSETHLRKKIIGGLVDLCIRNITIDSSNLYGFSEPILTYKAVLDNSVRKLLDKLQKVVSNKVVKSANVQHLEFKGQKIVTELFWAFRTDPERLLQSRDVDRYKKAPDESAKMRVICDYIAGMTDEYATKRYQQLFGPRIGSVFDRL